MSFFFFFLFFFLLLSSSSSFLSDPFFSSLVSLPAETKLIPFRPSASRASGTRKSGKTRKERRAKTSGWGEEQKLPKKRKSNKNAPLSAPRGRRQRSGRWGRPASELKWSGRHRGGRRRAAREKSRGWRRGRPVFFFFLEREREGGGRSEGDERGGGGRDFAASPFSSPLSLPLLLPLSSPHLRDQVPAVVKHLETRPAHAKGPGGQIHSAD